VQTSDTGTGSASLAGTPPTQDTEKELKLEHPTVRFHDEVTVIAISPAGSISGGVEQKTLRRDRALSAAVDKDLDFNWANRHRFQQYKTKPAKLRKRRNNSTDISYSSDSSMASPTGDEPQRNNSLGSLKSMVSSLKKVASSTTQNSDLCLDKPVEVNEENKPPKLDVLPDTRTDLEAHLNCHLSDLDRIRKSVQDYNDRIRDLNQRKDARARQGKAAAGTLAVIHQEIELIHKQRDDLHPFVEYFHGQIKRIADHRAELDKSQGLECTVYNMYLGFKRENEWQELFSYR
jgi:chromosome segregation ATPase